VLVKGSLPSGAQWGTRAPAGCALAITAPFYAKGLRDEGPGPDVRVDAAGAAYEAIAAGWVALMIRWRPGRRAIDAAEAIALMEAAYLVNAALCLLGFVGEREVGWYVTLAASPAFAAHVVGPACDIPAGDTITDPSLARLADGSWLMAMSRGQQTVMARSADGVRFAV
jgi:hypothetical protein